MTLAAGHLRHWVSLQAPTHTQDPVTGEDTVAWVEQAKVPAAIEPLSVREFIQSAAGQSEITAKIRMRYNGAIQPTWRIVNVLRGVTRIYNPAGILPDKDSGLEEITVPVTTGVNTGE